MDEEPYGEFKDRLKERGVPRSFTNWAKNYLSQGGMSYDEADISAYYDSSLSETENKENFRMSFPRQSVERMAQAYSERQQRAIERDNAKRISKEELEHIGSEPTTFESAGRAARLRRELNEQQDEPDWTNEPSPNVLKKELGLEFVEPVERKRGMLEVLGERVGQIGRSGIGLAKGAYSGYSKLAALKHEHDEEKYGKRQFELRQQLQRIRGMQFARREQGLLRSSQRQYMQPSQRSEVGYIDLSLGGPRMEGQGKRLGPNLSVGPSQNLGSSVGKIGNSPFGGGTGPSFGVRKGKTKWF